MTDTRYMLIDMSCLEYQILQEKLTKMAAKGWHLEKIGNFIWKFRRGEPQVFRYEIIYAPSASTFNSRPTEAEEDLADLCAQAGWERVGAMAQIQVYRNPDPNATPLETDEQQKLENIRNTMRRHFIPQHLLLIALFLFQLLMHGSTAMKYPTRTLSSSLSVSSLVMILWIILFYAALLMNDLLWLRRSRIAVDNGQAVPVNGFYRWFRWVVWSVLILYLLFLFLSVEPAITLFVLFLCVLIAGCVFATLNLCKRLKFPPWANFTVPVVVCSLIMMLAITLFISGMDSPYPSEDAAANAPLPLTLSELTGETGTNQLVIEDGSSALVSYIRYFDDGSKDQINCTLVEIHCSLFYDRILREQEQRYVSSSFYLGDSSLPDQILKALGAESLRRSTGPDSDRFLICWKDRILLLHATWLLTDDQIAILADVLKP